MINKIGITPIIVLFFMAFIVFANVDGLSLQAKLNKIKEDTYKLVCEFRNFSENSILIYLPSEGTVFTLREEGKPGVNEIAGIADQITLDLHDKKLTKEKFKNLKPNECYMIEDSELIFDLSSMGENKRSFIVIYKIPQEVKAIFPDAWTGEISSNIITVNLGDSIYAGYWYYVKMLILTILLSFGCIIVYRKIRNSKTRKMSLIEDKKQ